MYLWLTHSILIKKQCMHRIDIIHDSKMFFSQFPLDTKKCSFRTKLLFIGSPFRVHYTCVSTLFMQISLHMVCHGQSTLLIIFKRRPSRNVVEENALKKIHFHKINRQTNSKQYEHSVLRLHSTTTTMTTTKSHSKWIANK